MSWCLNLRGNSGAGVLTARFGRWIAPCDEALAMAPSNRNPLKLAPALFTAFLAGAAVGCSESSESAAFSSDGRGGQNGGPPAMNAGTDAPGQGAAERAIAEADIVQLAEGRLYAMSKSGTLSIVDVSIPGRLSMLGQAWLPGEPFEMYLRGNLLVAMTNRAYAVSGQVTEQRAAGASSSSSSSSSSSYADPNMSAGVIVIDVRDPGLMQRVATFPVPGEIADSRILGDILYLATYENAACYGCGGTPRTMVTTFDVSAPANMRQVDHLAFEGEPDHFAGWGESGWKRSIVATSERLYVGGHADVTPAYDGQTGATEGIIDVLDITDPSGKLRKGAHLETTGAILSRWQVDEKDGVLRVISQRGMGYTTNGVGAPEVQTFHIWNTGAMQPMGKMSLSLPRQEALKSVRFDGERAYAITFEQTDPLFVIDLSNEAAPKQRGELHMPGWVFHLEPRGDRVLGLGLDRSDANGNLNVSLFDVADMDNPKMLQRVAFGSVWGASDQAIVSYELPEDQDRIQKAFRIFENGLVVVPFSGQADPYAQRGTTDTQRSCETFGGGIQLIDWNQDLLVKQATLPVAGNPRRALLNEGELIAVSDSNVTTFDLARRDVALKTADLVIGTCETRPLAPPRPTGGGWEGDDSFGDEGHFHGHCSTTRTGASGAGASTWGGLALGIAAFGALTRRRRQRG